MLKKIILARNYGFCMGVKRAIKIADETAQGATEQVTILNEIVHNEAVVERFRSDGVGQAMSVDDVGGGTLIISAHGVAPDILEAAESKGLNVINATCPLVTRIYDIIKGLVERDFYIIHFGDPNHDETQGVVGHAPDRITVVSSIEAIDAMPEWGDRQLALTTQTTSSMEESFQFQRAAQKKWPLLEVFDTICNATSQLQSAIVDLAPLVDMILVVGSTTSANSKRLASIANTLCGKGILIGSAEEISKDWFAPESGVSIVGISAGASTPDFLVEAAVKKLVLYSDGKAEVEHKERRKKRRPATPGKAS